MICKTEKINNEKKPPVLLNFLIVEMYIRKFFT